MLRESTEIAERLRVHDETLKNWRYKGRGPAWINIGTDAKPQVRYRDEDVDAWLEARRVIPALRP